MPNFTPHSSIVPFFADAAEPGIPEFDANRIMAYAQYEQFYWNHPESFPPGPARRGRGAHLSALGAAHY
jgi:hypothetical protein